MRNAEDGMVAMILPEELRKALSQMRDPSKLGASPLVRLLRLGEESDPGEALYSALQKSIEALRPLPCNQGLDQTYRLLYERYILGNTQVAVAESLCTSPRHVRRLQSKAIKALANYIVLRYDIAEPTRPNRYLALSHNLDVTQPSDSGLQREMAWLVDHQKDRTSDLRQVLLEALRLVESMAAQRQIRVDSACPSAETEVTVPHTIIKEALLNVITPLLVQLNPGSQIGIYCRKRRSSASIHLTARGDAHLAFERDQELQSALQVSARLLELFGGVLSLSTLPDRLVVRIGLPSCEHKMAVLAIEDNPETLDLWRRYLQETRFSLVAETDPKHAVHRAVSLQPDIIVLDVMLETSDGWEILQHLRDAPETYGIPVVVCTVLPQRELALSLGAQGFMQKPTRGGALQERNLRRRPLRHEQMTRRQALSQSRDSRNQIVSGKGVPAGHNGAGPGNTFGVGSLREDRDHRIQCKERIGCQAPQETHATGLAHDHGRKGLVSEFTYRRDPRARKGIRACLCGTAYRLDAGVGFRRADRGSGNRECCAFRDSEQDDRCTDVVDPTRPSERVRLLAKRLLSR